MADASIEFKGSSFTLSVLHLKTSMLVDIRTDLADKVAQAPDFFYLVPIVVSIEQLEGSIDYQAIKTLIESFNFTFVGFTGTVSKEQRTLIRELGFSFVNTAKVNTVEKNTISAEAAETKIVTETPARNLFSDKIHRGQIRSGQQVYAKDQNLVVIGSVSAGAEVIADGNIHVYGSLRGRAIAGATGHHRAQIYCQNLEAELVSINGNYWLSESMEQYWGSPAYIHLTDSELTSSKLI
ncbi:MULTISPECIES: septum site-determining protein MinC [unclassified Colwellia]|uniref:septum site-determining protein MinC n=1 Tax=unclassified Colwellia TaxID=196834 RepID=UPI0015F59599|nr:MULTISPECIES: septum site-determining protein MinC [unclassified Colwellia]MBA6231651.1 septum site-determining protein MinC [Colwellia sp. MB02u-7]MBA6235515.1 septum site-determining protein MinC [Colwellia sp. MB02u-11]MBA6258069.1 septum site-determining protein MinC [Colwellia sp. MB3u-28]MBA6259763.1 septum site-determining protein MinC [Colwellia sp. MB3u-41]MBA6300239.1 septum site-determining protein MinC [Colwellia sp. MB3u-22]